MTIASRRLILQGAFFGVACARAAVGAASAQTAPASPAKPGQKYVWTRPLQGCAADLASEFDAPGAAPECGMPLIAKAADPKARWPPNSPRQAPPRPQSPRPPDACPLCGVLDLGHAAQPNQLRP